MQAWTLHTDIFKGKRFFSLPLNTKLAYCTVWQTPSSTKDTRPTAPKQTAAPIIRSHMSPPVPKFMLSI